MVVFWILAVGMTLVALAFVLVPLLRTPVGAAPTPRDANLDVLRAQRREIDADVASGLLPVDARDEALAELVGRADEDLGPPTGASMIPPRSAPWIAGIAAVAIPALAFGLYLVTGSPGASDHKPVAVAVAVAAAAAEPADDRKIVEMVESLARKVRERPDDAKGWSLLARSMGALGRFQESAEAYATLVKLTPGDPEVLADYADALGMAQGRTLAGKPVELAMQALKIDPTHKKALALAGTAAMDAGNYKVAAMHWQKLAAQLPPDSADEKQVQAILGEIRLRATSGAPPATPSPATLPPATPPRTAQAAPATGQSVSGLASLAPSLAAQVTGTETLFIYARAEAGSRIPLAILRSSAAQLPLRFALDDSQAMAPGMNLSSAASVKIEARISRSGNASPQAGDLVGTSIAVKPGARDVKIVVDKVLP